MTAHLSASRRHALRNVVWPSATGRLFLAAVVMVATLAQTFGYVTAAVPRWSSFTVACRESVVLPALVVAIAATVWAWALRPDNVVIGRFPAYGVSQMVGHITRTVTISAVSGYLLGLLPLCIRTAAQATFAFIDPLTLCAAVAGLMMVGVISVWIGVVMPTHWASVAAVVAVLAAAWLPLALNLTVLANRSSILAPALIWFNDFPGTGWRVTWQANIFRIALYLIVTFTADRLAHSCVDGRRIRIAPDIWCGSVIAAIAVIATVIHPVTLVESDQSSARCDTYGNGTITICLHPADETIRQQTFNLANRFMELTGWNEPIRIVESPVMTAGDVDAVIIDSPSGRADTATVDITIREGLLAKFAGYDACLRNDGPVSNNDPTAIIRLVHNELRIRSGGEAIPIGIDETTGDTVLDPRQNRLRDLDDRRFTEWYVRNRQAILGCTVTPEALP